MNENIWSKCRNFEETLSLTEVYEREAAKYLIDKCCFLDVIHTGTTHKSIAAEEHGIKLPDLMGVHRAGKTFYLEIKRKNRRWKFNDNGINLDLVEHYLKAQEIYKTEVFVLFKDNPQELEEKMEEFRLNGEDIDCRSWFVDDRGNGIWYGNHLTKLLKETPDNPITLTENKGKKIKCFPLANMKSAIDLFTGVQLTLGESLFRDFQR
jgi:hypothetical protein